MRRGGGDIPDGMKDAFRNKHFVARFCNDLFSVDGQLEPPTLNGHELVRRVDEIIPLSSGRVGERDAGIATSAPVLSHLVTIEGHWEFLTGEVGH